MKLSLDPTSDVRDQSGATGIDTEQAIASSIKIAGREYITPEILAEMLGVSTRTLARWDVARIGPPKIKVGKLVLFELAKLPEWLAKREIAPVRLISKRR